MDSKKLVLVGILVIIGAGAFVYLDPLGLDLLGLKQGHVVVQPAAKPGAVAPAAKPSVAAPKPAVAPAQVIAPVAAPPTPSSRTAAPAATPTAAAPVQIIQPPMKLAETSKTANATQSGKPAASTKPTADKPMRPKDLDMRHCLELETDAAIAKCAGE